MTEKIVKDILARIKRRSNEIGLKERQISLRATGHVDTIRNWRTKGVLPRLDTITQVAKALDVSPEWLAFGAGESVITQVPKISFVQAGTFSQVDGIMPSTRFDNSIEVTNLPYGEWYAFDVEGDSMDRISPPGSTIIVNRLNKALVSNACYVISDDEEGATYKRFRANPTRFEPVSNNPEHEPMFIDNDNFPTVFGRVYRSIISLM